MLFRNIDQVSDDVAADRAEFFCCTMVLASQEHISALYKTRHLVRWLARVVLLRNNVAWPRTGMNFVFQ